MLLGGCGEDSHEPVSTRLIADAVIHDGSGSAPFEGDLRFDTNTGRIVELGDLDVAAGEPVIEANGLVLAPGFIDSHSHHVEEAAQFRGMPGLLSQGVTTAVTGMDGFSFTGTVAEFNSAFERDPTAINVAAFSAHNTIRTDILGDDFRRPADTAEIEAMVALIVADMEAGALGISTGLEYEPGIYASTEEVIELARAAAAFGGIYHSHVRDEDDRFVDAVDEILRIGREAGIPVHLTHIKLADRLAWGTVSEILARFDAARADGIDITADIYPYERWASNIAILFPDRDFTSRAAAEFTFERTAVPGDILLSEYPPDPELAGMTVDAIANFWDRDALDTLLALAQAADAWERETGQDSQIIVKSMVESDIVEFLQWPFMSICSDGWHGGHPRGYGAFPRVLGRYVRDLEALSLAEAVYRMTALSAETLGIRERGRLVPGNFADLVLFDPDTITDHATMQDPMALSTGVEMVWVNGQLAFRDGTPTGAFAGQVIRRAE